MLKCVTAEVIIGLYSYCIKMSPIKKDGIRQRSTIQDFAPFPPQSVPSSHPFFLSLSSPFLLRPYFLLEETSLLSSHFLLNFIFPVYFYFLISFPLIYLWYCYAYKGQIAKVRIAMTELAVEKVMIIMCKWFPECSEGVFQSPL